MSEPTVSPASYAPPPELQKLQTTAGLLGSAGVVACLLGVWLDASQFYQSYLVAYLFWLGIALGCFAVGMLHHLSRGEWGAVVRRILDAASRTLPYLFVLLLPIVLGMEELYVWAQEEAVAADELLQHKSAYLNERFFIVRAVIYFAAWILVAALLSWIARRQDREPSPKLYRATQLVAAPGLGLYALTASFASFDWLMSLDPHWYSTIYGVYFVGGQGVAAFAFLILVAAWLAAREPMSRILRPRHFHDWGNLLLAFVMLWAYFCVSQLLIVWAGNLPEEVTFYVERSHGGWLGLGVALVVLHFALPFVLLLSRDLKRDPSRLARLAVLVLVMRWVDIYWQVGPVFHHDFLLPHWLDLASVVAIGGIWGWLFVHQLKRRPLVPAHDPYLAEAMKP